jgi:anti-sigma factor RsiW
MKKNHVSSYLSEYLDGAPGAKKKAQISEHLAECPECRKEYALFQSMRTECLTLAKVETNPFFVQRVIAEYRKKEKESFWGSFELIPRLIIQGAFIISIIIFIVLFLPIMPGDQSTVELPRLADYSLITDQQSTEQVLETNDQALLFALSADSEIPEGGQ